MSAALPAGPRLSVRSPPARSAAGLSGPAAGDDDLEALRGAGRRAPWSGPGLAVGAVTLAGVPPTAGFVSEWFLLESLMQQFRVTAFGGRLTLAVAGAAVALTAGFAGVTFVRVIGLIVLGPPAVSTAGNDDNSKMRPRGETAGSPGGSGGLSPGGGSPGGRPPGESRDYGLGGRIAVVALAACPLAIAALTPLEIRVIAAGLSPVVPGALALAALKSPWVLQPVFAGFSVLSPSWLRVEIPLMTLAVTAVAAGLSGRRCWPCAYTDTSSRDVKFPAMLPVTQAAPGPGRPSDSGSGGMAMVEATALPEPWQVRLLAGGNEGIADTLKDGTGGTAGMRPHELLEASLAACMTITARMALAGLGAAGTGVRVRVRLEREEQATRFRYELLLDPELEPHRRAVMERIARSPVRATLSRALSFEAV